MRAAVVMLAALVTAGACGDDGGGEAGGAFVSDERIVYSDGLHNENTAMIALDDRILLVFRGGESGQIGSDRAHLNVYASFDRGATWLKQAEVSANNLPDGRDIRDPSFVRFGGRLFMYAISRLPGGHYRDLLGRAWTVRSESTDGGATWSAPVNTFPEDDVWGFWRFAIRAHGGAETLYATGYNDGDTEVGLFRSDDGEAWEKVATIFEGYDDVPSETELAFFGEDDGTAVAIVRLDNQEILQDGQSAICTSQAPFLTWECGRRVETRFDGPIWLVHAIDGVERHFVFGRKHLPCTRKRTAIYELRGDLTDPASPVAVCEITEVKSSGDTAYTATAPLGGDRFLLAWYSSDVTRDVPWLEGQFTPSDIWMANVDLAQAPDGCAPPPAKAACPAPPLPAGGAAVDASGRYLVTVEPVIWPEQRMLFAAEVAVDLGASTLDVTLQPLDAVTHAPAGESWSASGVALAADGTFAANVANDVAV
ncbi:MAG: exo-alpha-sialidase, partial [Myxococcales bacterium]|nr:exo-alpha-sialidase [Myxococcales bacterium]